SLVPLLPDPFSSLSVSFFLLRPPPPSSTLFPYTTLFRSIFAVRPKMRSAARWQRRPGWPREWRFCPTTAAPRARWRPSTGRAARSEEHTSELQSLAYLVCRLLLEKKKIISLSLGLHSHRS